MWPFFGLKMASPALIIMYHMMAYRGVMPLCFGTSWVVEFEVLTTVTLQNALIWDWYHIIWKKHIYVCHKCPYVLTGLCSVTSQKTVLVFIVYGVINILVIYLLSSSNWIQYVHFMWLTCCFLFCNTDVLNRIMCSGKVTTTQIPFPTALLQVKVPVSLPPKTLHCHCVTVICD
jgi:hypothetical protein